MSLSTAYLCDTYIGKDNIQIAEPLLRSFGSVRSFSGVITTLRCFEDNSMVIPIVTEPGAGRVLVIDGGGSHRCALVDSQIAELAHANGWKGLVIYGCVREAALLSNIPMGILALHPHPLFCHKNESGERDVLVTFAGVNLRKGHFLYADSDGIIVSETMLS